ncbi:hypothetical protein QRD89_13335 [Halobacillus sp. ACCC02827]|uniref:hypothetical protein n=1 Tax=Bacillaceae TaxID=186817 RepID=UPI0002A4F839|nr:MULTISPECIES: hypothetical protein [Bacillaceae]ELK47360.1 hypothetical protein D479_07922 [Halobacillus sp. BAB-2008]QHT47469.1 hypothetical protein M662_13550 [Bacillus sp. SB49]WJE14695.1 hypothetical protein QRD89_13335 [Halobacillus sp. ACCC02827]
MVQLERKRNTYWNWKYLWALVLIPIGFYLLSQQKSISESQHLLFIVITIWLCILGVFGVTTRLDRLKAYGYLYLVSGVLFAYMGLVFIW